MRASPLATALAITSFLLAGCDPVPEFSAPLGPPERADMQAFYGVWLATETRMLLPGGPAPEPGPDEPPFDPPGAYLEANALVIGPGEGDRVQVMASTSRTRLVFGGPGEDGSATVEWLAAVATVTTLGDTFIANVQRRAGGAPGGSWASMPDYVTRPSEGFWYVRVALLGPDELEISLMDTGALYDAIEPGFAEGPVPDGAATTIDGFEKRHGTQRDCGWNCTYNLLDFPPEKMRAVIAEHGEAIFTRPVRFARMSEGMHPPSSVPMSDVRSRGKF